MSNVILSILGTFIAGLFVIIGYIIQKHFERRNSVNDKKLEIYSNYLQAHWRLQDQELCNSAEATHYKSLMLLYASDQVLIKFNKLNKGVDRDDPECYLKFKSLFDDLFLEMRKDILKHTTARLEDMFYCSPYLPDEKYKRFMH